MREIKFRAWDKEAKKWWDWGSLKTKIANFFELDFLEVNEFTGLKDKNGKEIYSGDLFMDEEDGTYNFVEWNDAYGGWGTNQWFLPKELVEQAPTLEIVGNIYEDAHLLNSSEGDII